MGHNVLYTTQNRSSSLEQKLGFKVIIFRYFVTFWGYMSSTAIFMFGQMVLIVALLKITKICNLFIPTSSEGPFSKNI